MEDMQNNKSWYFVLQYNDRYLLLDRRGGQPFDTCTSLRQLIDKCKNFNIPLNLISISPPDKDTLAKILEGYVGFELKPVKLEPDLVALIKGL